MFHPLLGVLDYIWDFKKKAERMSLFFEIVDQALTIFGLNSTFSQGFIKEMKLDKSWSLAN